MRKIFIVAAAAAFSAGPQFASAADSNSGQYKGGADIGPLGQCYSPPDCGGRERTNGYNGRGSYAQDCPIVRERVVTDSGRVIFRQRRACY
jgi:hypothetical protein